MATNSPFSMVVEMPSRARRSMSPSRYTLEIFRASISAILEHPRPGRRGGGIPFVLLQRFNDERLIFFQIAGHDFSVGAVADARGQRDAFRFSIFKDPNSRSLLFGSARGPVGEPESQRRIRYPEHVVLRRNDNRDIGRHSG